MYRFILIALMFIPFFGCQKTVKAPVSEGQLITILTDIHLAEAAVESETISVKDSMLYIYTNQILEKNQISRKDFDTTMSLYAQHPTRLDTIYKRVIRSLQKKDTLTGKF